MQTRYWSLLVGVVYLVVGIVGFIPALYTSPPASPPVAVTAGYGLLFGLFPINVLHNIFHILTGLIGIACFARFGAAQVYSRLLFLVYGLLTIAGFMPQGDTLFGIIPLFGNDIWLHAITALASAYFGWVAEERTAEPVPGRA